MKNHRSLLLIVACLALGGASMQAQPTNTASDSPTATVIRVACIGDSITQGAGSNNPYPAQLSALLGSGWNVKNFGVSGRTLLKKGDNPYWIEKAYTDAKAFQPNMVVIMLGTNDTKPQNWVHFDEFAGDYTELIESFKNLDSKPKIFVCRPCPVFAEGNYGINDPNLEKEMPVIDDVAAKEGATIIDLHAPLLDKPQTEPDRIHPNADGDAVMAKVIADALTAK